MIWLIEYDRPTGTTVQMRTFATRRDATDEAHNLEVMLHRHGTLTEREVVVLEATDEEQLRKTHGRYFQRPTP